MRYQPFGYMLILSFPQESMQGFPVSIHKQEKREAMFLNWLFRRIVLGPWIRLFFRVHVEGLENLPRRGPYIVALGPHRTEMESLIVATYLPVWLRFFAKQEYWDKHPILGKIMTGIGLIPLSRSAKAMAVQIKEGIEVSKKGHILAMYVEATRGFDESMHRGYPGFAIISMRSGGVPIVPVGLIGMRKFNPPGKKFRLRPGRATIVIGEPIYPFSLRSPEQHSMAEKALERVLIKPLVTKVSQEIARLSASPYDDKELQVPGS